MSRPVILVLISCLAAALPVKADSDTRTITAESYIADLFRATAETAAQARSDQSATNAVKTLIAPALPLDETAQFVLGRYWPKFDNPSVTTRFRDEFRNFIAEAVSRSLRAYPATLEVKNSRARPDGTVLVESSLVLVSGARLPLDWTLQERPEQSGQAGFQVRDFSLAGIDAASMLRGMAQTMLTDGRQTIDDVIPSFRTALRRIAPGTAEAGTGGGSVAP